MGTDNKPKIVVAPSLLAADFCNLNELEVKGIADGDVAKGIKAYNPILAGQLTIDEIEKAS